MMDKIEQLINEEVERRLTEKMTVYLTMISKNFNIPMSIMLRYLSTSSSNVSTATPVKSGGCLGVKSNGTRCSRNGKHGGYCGHHVTQREKNAKAVQHIAPSGHTHSVPPLYKKGCPECEKNKPVEQKKGVIDLKLLS